MKNILATKLFIPKSRSKLIARSRLLDKLNRGLDSKLTLISAPAGFGKTTLAGQWIDNNTELTAWLSLDERDNSVEDFIMYLVASISKIFEGFGEAIESLLNSAQTTNEAVLTILINEISMLEDFVLVLDDYHLIDSDEVNASLDFILDHMPPQMRVIITTRKEPNLSLAKLRVRNELVEIGIEDLRFTKSEAKHFFADVMSLDLFDKDIEILEDVTEGWIAGLQLSALSLQKTESREQFISSFSGKNRFVMDYLIEEVLKGQNKTIKKFLLYSSILKRFCAPLCDALLTNEGISSREVLSELEKANTFIIPLDNERVWYRYHHLFKELLGQQFKRSDLINEIDIKILHKRAAKWYEENRLYVEAFHHSIKAEDFGRAARLLEVKLICSVMDNRITEVRKLSEIVQTSTWIEMMSLLPKEYLDIRPVLISKYTWALLFLGEMDLVIPNIQQIEEILFDINENNSKTKYVIDDEEEFPFLKSAISSARAFLALVSQAPYDIEKYLTESLEFLPKNDYMRRGGVESILGLSYWKSGEFEPAERVMKSGIKNLMEIENYIGGTLCKMIICELMIEQGRLDKALDTANEALNLAFEKREFLQLTISSLYVEIGKVRLEQGDLLKAKENLNLSKKYGEKVAIPDWLFSWNIFHAKYLMAIDEYEQAIDELNNAEKNYIINPVPEVEAIECLKVRIFIKQRAVNKVLDWLESSNLSLNDDMKYIDEFSHITMLRAYIMLFWEQESEISSEDIVAFLNRLKLSAEKGNRIKNLMELLAIQVIFERKLGKTDDDFSEFQKLINLAEKERHILLFKSEGKEMYELLKEFASKTEKTEFIKALIKAFEEDKDDNMLNSSLIEALSERELEILKLISNGYSNKQIAEELFLALSTVKGYNQNIFLKLCVRRRTEAVAKARELKLI